MEYEYHDLALFYYPPTTSYAHTSCLSIFLIPLYL